MMQRIRGGLKMNEKMNERMNRFVRIIAATIVVLVGFALVALAVCAVGWAFKLVAMTFGTGA